MLTVYDDRFKINALAPLFAPILPHIITNLANVNRIIDDCPDRHMTEMFVRLDFESSVIDSFAMLLSPRPLAYILER